MSIINVGPYGLNMNTLNVQNLLLYTFYEAYSSSLRLFDNASNYILFQGSGFTYSDERAVTGGVINSIQEVGSGSIEYTITEMNFPAVTFYNYVLAGNNQAAFSEVLSGYDRIVGSDYADLLRGYGGNDTLHGNWGNDTLYGEDGDDQLLGGAGVDLLYGGAGDDVLDAGGDVVADTLVGGMGNDTYVVSIGDEIVENANEGVDTVISIGSAVLAGNLENLTLSSGNTGIGNEVNNFITGNVNANTLTGLGGDDTLWGAGGADTLIGGLGNDLYLVGNLSTQVTENSGEGVDEVHTSLASYTLASEVENLTIIGSNASNGTGNALNNVIKGNHLANSLSGLAGNDTLIGAGEQDTLLGGDDDDVYVIDYVFATVTENALEGTDTVRSSLVTYTLDANVENLVLTGFASNGFGNSENNLITGNAYANVLKGFGGDDTLDGGLGADGVSYSGASGGVTVNLQAGTATGEGSDTLISIENVSGSNFDDNLTGSALVNVLNGGIGNDTLDGGLGADVLAGGTGDDVYIIDASDTVIEAMGAGTDTIRTAQNVYVLSAANVENVTFTGAGAFNVMGNVLANVITGGAGNDTLFGAGGADTLMGGLGDDLYLVGNGTVVVTESGSQGTDTVQTGLSGYSLTANVENLTLVGAAASGTGNGENNLIYGNAAANTLSGLLGNDTINGAGGMDTLIGGDGDDLYVVGVAGATVTELSAEGTDTVRTSVATYTLDANVENLLLVSSALNGFGNAENNQITGNANANVLKGFGGDDTLDGGLGADTVSYSAASNGVTVNLSTAGAQLISADQGSDTLISIENVTGSNLDDSLTGSGAANVLNGGLGDDTLDGGAGADTLAGGAGDDVFIFDASDVVLEADGGGNDTLRIAQNTFVLAVANIENVAFTGAGNVNLTGNAGANVLTGGAGNDEFRTGGGLDTLIGGAGNDLYVIGQAGVVVIENAAGGTDTVRTSVAEFTLAANIENLIMVTTALNGYGNAENNSITGNASNNLLKGFAGNDTLDGGGGNDTVSYGDASGGVTVNLNFTNAQLIGGGEGTDTLISIENIVGSSHDDELIGNTTTGVIYGGLGNDTLNGGAGDDTLIGGDGDDVYFYRAADGLYGILGDTIIEYANEGNDTVVTGEFNYTLTDNFENLIGETDPFFGSTLTGNSADNVISAGSNNDRLFGLDGADTLNGGLGTDTLTGGAGDDVFLFSSAIGPGSFGVNSVVNIDTIADFTIGEDAIHLDDAIFTTLGGLGALSAAAFVIGTAALASDDRIIYDSTTGTLYYDDDGNGVNAQVQFAMLTGSPALSNSDFLVS